MNLRFLALLLFLGFLSSTGSPLLAGPYSFHSGNPDNTWDAPVPGFVGPHGEGLPRVDSGGNISNPDNYVNPLFFGWATGVAIYSPAPGVAPEWQDTTNVLGPVVGDVFHVASLGELGVDQITSQVPAGSITVTFETPIRNKTGADFVVFENGIISQGGAGVAGQVFGELAYVEVSSNGRDFARFPSRSLTQTAVGTYGSFDATNLFNLAGKHANGPSLSWGTPFNLSDLGNHSAVISGTVDLNAITHIRFVDIPGTGAFLDSAGSPIYDPWLTFGSGGFDLEAVGIVARDMNFAEWLQQREVNAAPLDPDGDGLENLLEYAFARLPDAPDNEDPPVTHALENGKLVLSFPRDERAVDLVYEVQASTNLRDWVTIARSTGGAPLAGVNGFSPAIVESRESPIATVGVIRRVSVTDVQNIGQARFLRLEVLRP